MLLSDEIHRRSTCKVSLAVSVSTSYRREALGEGVLPAWAGLGYWCTVVPLRGWSRSGTGMRRTWRANGLAYLARSSHEQVTVWCIVGDGMACCYLESVQVQASKERVYHRHINSS